MIEQSNTTQVWYTDYDNEKAVLHYVEGWFSTRAGVVVVKSSERQSSDGRRYTLDSGRCFCFVYRDDLVSAWEVVEFSKFPAVTMFEFSAALSAAQQWLSDNCENRDGIFFFKE